MIRRYQFFSIAICLLAAQASHAEEKVKQFAEPLSIQNSLTLFWGLLLVLAFIFVLLYILKRMGLTRFSRNGPIKVVHGVQLGQREKLVLIDIGGEQLLLSVTSAEIRKIHKLKTPVDIDWQNKAEQGQEFKGMIRSLLDKNHESAEK